MNKKNNPCVLAVDDMPENLMVLNAILNQEYKVKVATNGEMALKIALSSEIPDIILLDIMMPGMDGFEVCRQLKANPVTKNIPVIFVTSKTEDIDEAKGFEIGAVDYVTKPVSPFIVKARLKTHLILHNQNKALEEKVQQRTAELSRTRLEIIQRLGRAAEYRDNETGMHIIRMSHYCKLISLASGHSNDYAELVLNVSPMHDIGKIGIPDSILLKPGELNAKEWAIMVRHTYYGAKSSGMTLRN